MDEVVIQFKCVLVGDDGAGKTSLLMRQSLQTFLAAEHMPSMLENSDSNLMVEDQWVQLSLWDTAGSDIFDQLRPLSYAGTDVFVVCYSINSKESFESVKNKWVPEILLHGDGAPFILVGTKLDLREQNHDVDQNDSFVDRLEGERAVESLGAVAHFEVSSMKDTNVKETFMEVAKIALATPKKDEETEEPEIEEKKPEEE